MESPGMVALPLHTARRGAGEQKHTLGRMVGEVKVRDESGKLFSGGRSRGN
jgi:hypothetical protein